MSLPSLLDIGGERRPFEVGGDTRPLVVEGEMRPLALSGETLPLGMSEYVGEGKATGVCMGKLRNVSESRRL